MITIAVHYNMPHTFYTCTHIIEGRIKNSNTCSKHIFSLAMIATLTCKVHMYMMVGHNVRM